MACDCAANDVVLGILPIVTSKNTTDVFFALTAPLPTTDMKRVIARAFADCFEGDFSVQFAYQTSSDMSTWPSATGFGAAWLDNTVGAEGSWRYADTALSLGAPWIRFGMLVKNRVGSPTDVGALVVSPSFLFKSF